VALTDGRSSGFLRAFLDRFRRPAGVPAQVTDDVATELVPLFMALDGLEREAEAIRQEAARADARSRDAVTAEVEALVGSASETAERDRVRIAEEGLRAAEAEAAGIRRRAEEEAERIRAGGHDRISGLVSDVLGCVEEGLPS